MPEALPFDEVTEWNHEGTFPSLVAFRPSNLSAYAWPGGYPILYLDRHDEVLCPSCADAAWKRNLGAAMMDGEEYFDMEDGPTAWFIHYEGSPEFCSECNVETESAYGDPEAENEVIP